MAVLLVAIAVVALANWWSRWKDDDRVEHVTKPLVTIGVIALAFVVKADPSGARPWFIAALVFCLIGDVALLPKVDKFIVGLGSFLVGHILFGVGAVVVGVKTPWVLAALVLGALAVGFAGRQILTSVKTNQPKMLGPVAAYNAVIFAAAVLLVGTGRPWMVIGAVSFLVSDSILGWNRFVTALPWSPVAIMATYHLALVGLTLGLAA